MSAYLVDVVHIDLLVEVVTRGPKGWPVGPSRPWDVPLYLDDDLRFPANELTTDAIGRELWRENLKSINARYPDTIDDPDAIPGPAGVGPAQIEAYRFTRINPQLTAGEAAKAIHCLRYQSCEHPGWEKSRAAEILLAVEARLVTLLPGYDTSPWEWTARTAVESAYAQATV